MNRISSPDRCFDRLLLVTASIITLLTAVGAAGASDLDSPVARVNGVTIFKSDISCAVEASLARKLSKRASIIQGSFQKSGPAVEDITLKQLIARELLYQESLKKRYHGLIAESEEVYRNEAKRLGGEEQLASALECNNMTPDQFRKAIFRNLSIKHLLDDAVYSRIIVTEEEIARFYEENKEKFSSPRTVRISQILVKVSKVKGKLQWRQAENRAWTIYSDAASGADFVRLVRKHSDDPAGVVSGGDLGPVQHMAWAEESTNRQSVIDTQVFKLSEGSVTRPIRSGQGFHIFKITATIPPATKELEDVKHRINNLLRRQRASEMITRLIEDLKEKAVIEIMEKK